MRRLYIIRHGKAEDPSFSKRDFERNLVEKGQEDAARTAQALASDLSIDASTLVISSSANRAIQTAELMCGIIGYPSDQIKQEIQIYEAHHLDILKVINQVSDDVQTLLVFGHNPGLSRLVDYLSDQYVEMKTSTIVCLEFSDKITFSQLFGQSATVQQVFD